MTYEYPKAWGEISAQLFTGYTSGLGYDYSFGDKNLSHVAGGRSRDFSEPRDTILTDFSGSGPDASGIQNNPLFFGVTISKEVHANVVFMTQFLAPDYLCNPAYIGWVYAPIGIVAINLPKNQKINGFVFATELFSDHLKHELVGFLDSNYATTDANCQNAALRQQFDAKIKEINDAILAGTVESGTQVNINQLMHIAQSIRFD